MKAWVRKRSVRARSCQEAVSGTAFMGLEPSESRWGAGADDLTRLASDVAEAVRELTGEIIGFARAQHARGAPHGELDAPADHDARLLAPVRHHILAGRGSRR